MPLIGYTKVIPTPSLNIWCHSFVSNAADRQTDKQTRKSYPRRSTKSAWVITLSRVYMLPGRATCIQYIYVDGHMLTDTSCSFGIHVDCISATIRDIFIIGHIGNDFYGSDDLTNSVKALKDKTVTVDLYHCSYLSYMLVSLCIQQQTGDKLATILLQKQETC